ncbi:MAG: DNA cytosine methyltransferase [Collimonas sp.]|uniref:DNA cytosine methyltransferase n=1 Tax=Collimonas sp. TaxID=1963772 RepID=UPI0032673E5B
MAAYYNEINKYAAQWLRNLISAGHIAPGDVDERSIEDVKPDDLRGYTQCHFFAGIGVWSYALRRAGWPDDRPVWTGSCPCQPFSAAGRGTGLSDERHLWPAWHHLIRERRPGVVLGEQVEAAIGLGWLDLVQTDMEGSDYAFAPVGIPAAGVGSPNIRQRLWFVAHSNNSGSQGRIYRRTNSQWEGQHRYVGRDGAVSRLANTASHGQQRRRPSEEGYGTNSAWIESERLRNVGIRTGEVNGFWRDADWLRCTDGKWRPVESGTFPLAHGATSRVGRLRAFGNAINAEAATVFIGAVMESL